MFELITLRHGETPAAGKSAIAIAQRGVLDAPVAVTEETERLIEHVIRPAANLEKHWLVS